MAQRKRTVDRRKFLAGILTGGGVAAAIGMRPSKARASKESAPRQAAPAEPILYRRTAEAERYYRTLYS
ncbi:MAG: twin-arginine translocation signal domain-containing protein [Candidatus Rokuibacteriota bacterium]